MARSKSKVKRKTRATRVMSRNRTAVVARTGALDAYGRAYARLLMDPCNAPLTRGLGLSTGDSIIVRLESDAILFNGATFTAGVLVWTPGSKTSFINSYATDTGGSAWVSNAAGIAGGFLNSNSTSYKCLAACLQVSWPGSEQNRQGILGLGVVPSSFQTRVSPATVGGQASTASAADVRSLAQFVGRIPSDTKEIVWRPGPNDDQDFDYSSYNINPANLPSLCGNRNSIILSYSGGPVSTGIRVRTVAVYEYTPLDSSGFVSSVQTSPSVNSPADVLRAIDSAKGPGWFMRTVGAIGERVEKVGAKFLDGAAAAGGAYAARRGAELAARGIMAAETAGLALLSI